MPEVVHRTDDVFGISRDLPLNYQERETADRVLVDSLTRNRHIVIYGSSKQGKTSLRKHCLNLEDYITVHCSNKWQLGDLHAAILKKCGYEITLSNNRSSAGKQKIFASLTAGFLGARASGGAEAERELRQATETAPLEIAPEDVNDIISALNKINFTKYIVLEDFHYLPIETQKDFAVALKAFHENSRLCFLVHPANAYLELCRL